MVLVFVNMVFMLTSRNARLKRHVAVIAFALIASLMLAFVLLSGLWWVGLLVVPALALAFWFNGRKIRICDACGFTNLVENPFQSDPLCGDCGKPLDTNRRWL